MPLHYNFRLETVPNGGTAAVDSLRATLASEVSGLACLLLLKHPPGNNDQHGDRTAKQRCEHQRQKQYAAEQAR